MSTTASSSLSRRHFLAKGALAATGIAIPGALNAGHAADPKPLVTATPNTAAPTPIDGTSQHRFKLGIATYSYWHFQPKKFPIEAVIDKAAALEVEGVDILHRQMESEENAYCQRIKRHAFLNGIDLICLSMHQNFVNYNVAKRQFDPEKRAAQVAHTHKCLEIASRLGIPSMRINAGQWGTTKSFDKLMENRGIEAIPEGATEDDAFKWAIESIRQCLDRAAELGVILALENHWGLSSTPEGMLRIHREINSPWLALLPDTGNFLENPYDKLAKVFPHAAYVQAKTYYGGGEWYTLDLDYKRIFRLLRDAGYKGYVGIEFEGKAPGDEGTRLSVEHLRACSEATSGKR
ncbi:MAG: sugar phosphate isomerase/epimerase [Puniceicoccales bacterium]|jgi:sugar phosphate isomerase/epimerase|nr:sugar phosphate isomerase/epimerase [Puniceicoccales bacterium]